MAIRRRTNAYWAKRADERLLDSEKTSETYRKKVREVYAEAQRETLKQLKQIYSTYWSKDSGFDKQKLNTLTTISDMNRFVAELKKSGLYDQIPDNYKGRITRLEYLNAQMWLEAHKAGLKQDELVTESNRKVYEDSYYRSIFDVSKGIGSTPAFNTLDTATVNKALEAKFDGKNYSERIWGNSDILANQLQAKLAVAIATGQSIHKTAREFRERFHVQNYYAERLIRTETNYFHNSAEIESYKSMGFEYFQFLATLDNRTSEICQDMDGKKFKVSEGMPGENIPPLHPNCRSTIVPYFKGYEPEERIYRDPKIGRNKYMYNVDYNDWRKNIGRPDLGKNSYYLSNIPYQILDKTDELLSQARPGIGSIKKAKNYDEVSTTKFGAEEKEAAEWLKNTLGGNIIHVPTDGKTSTPDFRWNKVPLELKTLSTDKLNTITKRMREGAKQSKGGGIMLNVTDCSELLMDKKALWDRVQKDLLRFDADFVIVRNGNAIEKYFVKVKKKAQCRLG